MTNKRHMVFIETDILKPSNRVVSMEDHDTLLEYLQDRYPNGFETSVTISINNKEVMLEDYDTKLNDYDTITIVKHPGIAAAVAGFTWTAFFTVAAQIAAGYVLGQVFKPKMPKEQTTRDNSDAKESVYNVNSKQNTANRTGVIPIIYGSIRVYPSLITPPYYRYEDNEQYVYQLMAIGHGLYDINDIKLDDTAVTDGSFQYKRLTYPDYSSVDGIKDSVQDSEYYENVVKIPSVENLEIRGEPFSQSQVMRMSSTTNTIELYEDINGNKPDISFLESGDKITLSGTLYNDGEHTVVSSTSDTITVTNIVTTEPNYSIDLEADTYHVEIGYNGNSMLWRTTPGAIPSSPNPFGDEEGSWIRLAGDSSTVNEDLRQVTSSGGVTGFNTDFALNETIALGGNLTATVSATSYDISYDFNYGPYTYESDEADIIGIELDYVFPGGLFNSDDTTGDLTSRTVDLELDVYYPSEDKWLTTAIELSTTGQTASAIRKSYRSMFTSHPESSIQVKVKRLTAEPENIRSHDEVLASSIKVIRAPKDNSDFGDLTLLWTKTKATNNISGLGQFSINAWVQRTDKSNDIESVLTDLYTNTVYGAGLPVSDLEFGGTIGTDLVNGAIDTKMVLYEAMDMIAKANQKSIYPVGSQLILKSDSVKPIRTALYNETNMIKDSFKLSWYFDEEYEDTDSVKTMYRSPTDFSEASYTYPTTGTRPEVVELWGCTDLSQATNVAQYLYKSDRSRRKTVEFKTDIQGLIPEYLDRIGISHTMPSWGYASQVISTDYDGTAQVTNDIILVDAIDTSYNKIIFRKDDGSVSDILDCTVQVASPSTVTVSSLPTWVHGLENGERTSISIGTTDTIVKDYVITSVKPDADTVTIQAVNYDPSIY